MIGPFDVDECTSLIVTFMKEMPESIFTDELVSQFMGIGTQRRPILNFREIPRRGERKEVEGAAVTDAVAL